MNLIFCIPARNEAGHIGDAIRRLARSLDLLKGVKVRWSEGVSEGQTGIMSDSLNEVRKSEGEGGDGPKVGRSESPVEWKIMVSVNGSTDGTLERARAISNEFLVSSFEPDKETRSSELGARLEVIDCPKAGKGAAVKCAAGKSEVLVGSLSQTRDVRRATCDDSVFGFIDADLSADPDAIPGMVQKIIDDEADVVIASRLLQTKTTNRGWLRNVTSTIFNLFARALLGIRVKDAQCGLKVMNEKAVNILKNCQEDGWFLDIEFLSLASRQGLRIIEVPVPWTEFRYPDRKSQIRHVRDGWGALVAMIRIRRRRE